MHLCTATMIDSSNHDTGRLSTRPSILSVLPEELLLLIFHCLEPVTLLRCRRVCKGFSEIVTSDVGLVYKIELFADGMVNSEDCRHTALERLGLLRKRRQAWKELSTVLKEWNLGTQRWNAYELVDGIFAQTMNTTQEPNSRGILFASLPSRDFEGSVLKYDDVGFSFRDFAMDPTQDLIAYLQCTALPLEDLIDRHARTVVTVFLRTMSTNKLHKNAAKETLSITIPNFVQAAVIQIVDNVIGLMMWDNFNHSKLFIWNWVAGSLVVSEIETPRIDDFVFISNCAYAVAIPAPDSCLQVYTFDSSSEISATNPTGICLRAALYPPIPNAQVEVSVFGIHTGPFTTPNSPPPCFRPSKPFTTSSQSRIHVTHLSFSSSSRDLPTEFYLVVIHNKTFLKYIDIAERERRPLHLAWNEWGMEGGAWIPGGTNSSWLRYVHGERLARLCIPRPSGTRYLEIYDFSVSRDLPSWIPREEYRKSFYLPGIFNQQSQFKLPCRLIREPQKQPYAGFMIDEDRLIGIKDFNDDPRLFDVYTF